MMLTNKEQELKEHMLESVEQLFYWNGDIDVGQTRRIIRLLIQEIFSLREEVNRLNIVQKTSTHR